MIKWTLDELTQAQFFSRVHLIRFQFGEVKTVASSPPIQPVVQRFTAFCASISKQAIRRSVLLRTVNLSDLRNALRVLCRSATPCSAASPCPPTMKNWPLLVLLEVKTALVLPHL